jgi:nucleoside-diphosphate-sugar epimerase
MQSPATGIFNIGSGEKIDLTALAGTLSRIMKVPLPPVYGEPRAGDIRDSVSDITAVKKTLGYVAAYPLEKGLAETIRYFRDRKTGVKQQQ